eukprot:scaffold10.g2473.t1
MSSRTAVGRLASLVAGEAAAWWQCASAAPAAAAAAASCATSTQQAAPAAARCYSPRPKRHGRGSDTGPPAFVLDIDGCLVQGHEVLPAARRALSRLYQVVLSHTPMRPLAKQLGDRQVLVSGRGLVAEVAKAYGFKRVVTPRCIVKAVPEAVPFFEDQGAMVLEGHAATHHREPLPAGTEADPIRAVLVMTDPSNWYLDLQLIIDVILGKGVLGRRPEETLPGDDEVQLTGQPLKATTFGKPSPETYRLTEQQLLKQARAADQLGLTLPHSTDPHHSPFSAIYAIGDNPYSDVAGANAAGEPWVSVLVTKTGVARENSRVHPAQVVVDDVDAAVQAAVHRSRSLRWHSMR